MTCLQIRNFVLKYLHLDTIADFWDNYTDMETVANSVLDDIYGSVSWKNLGYFGNFTNIDIIGSIRIYQIPDAILNKIKKIEAYLGSSWRTITIRDINDVPDFQFNEAWITENYSDENPVGLIFGNQLYILSGQVIAASAGLRFYYYEFPDKIESMDSTMELSAIHTVRTPTGTTFSIGLPRQFHKLVAMGIINEFKQANEMELVGKEATFNQDLAQKLNELSPLSADESFKSSLPVDDGQDY